MSRLVWLIFFSDNTDDVQEYFKTFNLPFDCIMMASIRNKNSSDETIMEVYRVDKNNDLKITKFATWGEKFGLETNNDLFYSKRNSLDGKILRVVTVHVRIIHIIIIYMVTEIFCCCHGSSLYSNRCHDNRS